MNNKNYQCSRQICIHCEITLPGNTCQYLGYKRGLQCVIEDTIEKGKCSSLLIELIEVNWLPIFVGVEVGWVLQR